MVLTKCIDSHLCVKTVNATLAKIPKSKAIRCGGWGWSGGHGPEHWTALSKSQNRPLTSHVGTAICC